MSTDDKKDPVPSSMTDLVIASGPGSGSDPVVLSEAERQLGDVEGRIPPAPSTATTADLQSAVGVTPRSPSPAPRSPSPAFPSSASPSPASPSPSPRRPVPDPDLDSDDADAARKPRRWPLVVALTGVLTLTVAAFILLGNANEQRYYLRCSAKSITAEQGRSFPPWGTERLTGAAWRPISIPPNAECTPQSTSKLPTLEGWYLEALVDQATSKLSGSSPGDIDAAQTELEQAMLLTRSPDRRDQRKDLERLLGDVTYWRAAAKVKSAAASLEDAAKRFDEAASKRPRHASDASAWAEFTRLTAKRLGAGPAGDGSPMMPPSGVPLSSRPSAPLGTALPVEMPSASTSDAGVPLPDAAVRNIPAGGVLM